MNKKCDSKLAKPGSTTNGLVKKNVAKKANKKVSKQEKENMKNPDFSMFKEEILKLKQEKLLDKLKKSKTNEYFETMKNDWIIEKHIARYGLCNNDAPENSIIAYENAVKHNFAILISVRCLKDGNIICYKDETLGKLSKDGYISNLTLDEAKNLHILNSKYTPPTLEEALESIKGKAPVIIEIFNESIVGKMEETIVKILDEYSNKYNCIHDVAVMSMNPYVLNWFFNFAPWYTRIVKSCGFKATKIYANIKTKKLKKFKFKKLYHADFACYNAKDLPCKYIKKVKPIGIIAYNVSDQAQYQDLLTISDNVIFSNFIPEI